MNAFKRFFARTRNAWSKIGSSPSYDWYFALSCFVVGLCAAIAIDALLFVRLSSEANKSSAGADLSALTINLKDIEGAVELVKKDDVDSSVVPPVVLVDPSR